MILGTWRVEYSFLTLPKAYREIKSYLGYFPIFCFRFDDAKTAILHSLMIEPNQGQELVVFESDDFVKIDIVKWARYVSAMVQKKKDGIKLEECFEIEDDKYCAYIVKDIENPIGKMFLKDMVFNEYKIDKNNPLKFAGKMDYEMYLKALFDEMTELLKSIFGEEWYENKEINPENVIIIKENALLCMAPFIYSGILNMDIGSAPLLMLDGYFSSKCFDKRLEFFNYEKDIEAKTHEAFDEIYKGIEGFFGNSLNSVYIKTSGIKVGRNDPCPCGSGKKYKKCCGR